MKIKYLGTGAAEGIPAIFCNCSICKNAKNMKGKEIRTRCQAIIDEEIIIDFGTFVKKKQHHSWKQEWCCFFSRNLGRIFCVIQHYGSLSFTMSAALRRRSSSMAA